MNLIRALEGPKNRFFFLLLKLIDKLSKNIFTKLQRAILSIFEDMKPKVT